MVEIKDCKCGKSLLFVGEHIDNIYESDNKYWCSECGRFYDNNLCLEPKYLLQNDDFNLNKFRYRTGGTL